MVIYIEGLDRKFNVIELTYIITIYWIVFIQLIWLLVCEIKLLHQPIQTLNLSLMSYDWVFKFSVFNTNRKVNQL